MNLLGAAIYMSGAEIAMGVIISLVLGFAAGNYACSLVHRLPRGKSILEHKPYCGECGHPLATADLFPVLSAIMLKHRCRYCGVKIPMSHFWTEILIGVLFVLSFLQFGFSERYFLVLAAGVFWITLAAIEINDRKIQLSVLLTAAVIGLVLRTLVDGTIYPSLLGALYGLLIGMVIWRKHIQRAGHRYTVPDYAKVLAAVGATAGTLNFVQIIVLGVIAYALTMAASNYLRRGTTPLTAAMAGAVIILLLLFS